MHVIFARLIVPESFVVLLVHRQASNILLLRKLTVIMSPSWLIRELIEIFRKVNGLCQISAVAYMTVHCQLMFPGHIINVRTMGQLLERTVHIVSICVHN